MPVDAFALFIMENFIFVEKRDLILLYKNAERSMHE
jgi:hypothetical protein